MKPEAKVISHDGVLAKVEVVFDSTPGKDEGDIAWAVGSAVLMAVRLAEDPPPEETKPAESLPQMGDDFEGTKVVAVKVNKARQIHQIETEDGIIVGFNLVTGGEVGRKQKVVEEAVPGPGVGTNTAPGSGEVRPVRFIEIQTLSGLADAAFEETNDESKALELLESIKDEHPVLKTAAPTWKDRAQRRIIVKKATKEMYDSGETRVVEAG